MRFIRIEIYPVFTVYFTVSLTFEGAKRLFFQFLLVLIISVLLLFDTIIASPQVFIASHQVFIA
jgi:hypothetical protein